jgi:hypothetical protein
MKALNETDTPLTPVLTDPPPGNRSTLYWGYEANFMNSKLNAYKAVSGNPLVASCVPNGPHIPPASNGRGVAFDPLDGNLWISRLTGFLGDARITKITPPNVPPGRCNEMYSLLVHYSDGTPPEEPDFGALDTDQGSKHIWAAGYEPVVVLPDLEPRSYFYLVNRNNGLIIQSCYLHLTSNFPGNDSLAYARLPGLPGSGQYLLTDDGEFAPTDPLLVIDTADCHNGKLVTPVASFPKTRGMTGIDFEWLGLLNTDLHFAYNNGDQPFATTTVLGPTGAVFGLEDIALCAYRAKFGGGGNDGCPYENVPVPPAIASCLPTSSLSVLSISPPNVNAYVPNGSWSESTPDVQLVPIEGTGTRATITTPNPVNSCSSNSSTGETVCTGNATDVYLISGSTLTATLADGATGSQFFSGGTCKTCGVAIDSSSNTAVLAVGLATGGPGGYQFLDLATNTFATPIPAGTETSEDISLDPVRHFVLSPNEQGNYQILRTSPAPPALFNRNIAPPFEEDSAAEDCSTGIALASVEFTTDIFITDLTQATFTPGTPAGTWTAPSQFQSFPEFSSLAAGVSGIAVAPGSHLGVVTGEFGGSAFGAIELPATSGTGIPAIVDYVAANIPSDPSGAPWQMGRDPHTVTAYVSPNTGKAYAVIANDTGLGTPATQRTFLAVVDLAALLAAPRVPLTHQIDPTVNLVTSGIVRFVSVH